LTLITETSWRELARRSEMYALRQWHRVHIQSVTIFTAAKASELPFEMHLRADTRHTHVSRRTAK